MLLLTLSHVYPHTVKPTAVQINADYPKLLISLWHVQSQSVERWVSSWTPGVRGSDGEGGRGPSSGAADSVGLSGSGPAPGKGLNSSAVSR